MHSKAYRIYNKCVKTIEECIHVIFDESTESKLSDSLVQKFHLNKHSDEEEERLKETRSIEINFSRFFILNYAMC